MILLLQYPATWQGIHFHYALIHVLYCGIPKFQNICNSLTFLTIHHLRTDWKPGSSYDTLLHSLNNPGKIHHLSGELEIILNLLICACRNSDFLFPRLLISKHRIIQRISTKSNLLYTNLSYTPCP